MTKLVISILVVSMNLSAFARAPVEVRTVSGEMVQVDIVDLEDAATRFTNRDDRVKISDKKFNGDGSVTLYSPRFWYRGEYVEIIVTSNKKPNYVKRRDATCKLFGYKKVVDFNVAGGDAVELNAEGKVIGFERNAIFTFFDVTCR